MLSEKMSRKYEKYYVCQECHNGMTVMGGTENKGEIVCPFCNSKIVELRKSYEVSDDERM